MFENEVTDFCCSTCKAEVNCKEKCECWHFARKGAELGYQKGIKTKVNITTISDCPIKDEWHYMKDGIMPEENQWVLVYDSSYTVCNYQSNTPIKWLDNYDNEVPESDIIAWREIVPPIMQFEKRVEHTQELKKQTEQNKKETELNPDYFSGGW